MLRSLKYTLLALFEKRSYPEVTPDTFFVWEPCSDSHGEVVPGYAKYLLDLGFHVSVLLTPKRLEEGLFSRFSHERLHLNRMSQAAIVRYFRERGLSGAKGILITTARKIGDQDSYRSEYRLLSDRTPAQKLLLVEHDVKHPADHNVQDPNVITLQPVHYKNFLARTVNPHYFGNVSITPKNNDTTVFITTGSLRARRRSTKLLIDAVSALHDSGVRSFRTVVIGEGDLQGIREHLRPYFDIKGRVSFEQLYSEIEAADFFLPLLDPDNASHERYVTTGTSGTFQLIMGFVKPCIIASKFAAATGLDNTNSIIYPHNHELANAMTIAVSMPPGVYLSRQAALQQLASTVYDKSLNNLRELAGTPD